MGVIDAHAHLYDWRENRYLFLETPDPMFEALIGDYSSLPRIFGLADYQRLNPGVTTCGIVWHEFLSTDPIREVAWAEQLASRSAVPMAIVGLVDFLAQDLDARLAEYARNPRVSAVRQHLGWDPDRADRRFAARGDLLADPKMLAGLGNLAHTRFKCSLEVFSPQLPSLAPIVEALPGVGFNVAVMGWPSATDGEAFSHWRAHLRRLAVLPNTRITISALECVFGMNWRPLEAQRWVDTVIDLFGVNRVMVGSHTPLSSLARHVQSPYAAYLELTAGLSAQDRRAIFHDTARDWYFPDSQLFPSRREQQCQY
jgi:predicted TIM-barrel fold metal-dependent hydrolase